MRSAGTETTSRSGYRSAVSVPPNTQPVSRHIVLLTHSAVGAGVWPYSTIALPRYSLAHGYRTGRPNSSVSPVVSPYRQKALTLPDARPWYFSMRPACDTTRRPPSST